MDTAAAAACSTSAAFRCITSSIWVTALTQRNAPKRQLNEAGTNPVLNCTSTFSQKGYLYAYGEGVLNRRFFPVLLDQMVIT